MENKNTPFISIIIIGYNLQKLLNNCLQSALGQDYPNFEVVFVDDGSTDNTLPVALQIQKENPNLLVFSKENGGIVSARQFGLLRSKGDYVMFVDGDDWIPSFCLSNLVIGLRKFPLQVIDIVSSRFFRQNPDKSFTLLPLAFPCEFCEGQTFFRLIMADELPHYMFPRLYRREFLVSAGYLSLPHVSMAEDLMSNIVFGLAQPKCVFVNSANYFYSFNPLSLTRKKDKKILNQVQTLCFLETYFKDHNEYDKNKSLLEYQWFSYLLAYFGEDVPSKIKHKLIICLKKHLANFHSNSLAQTKYFSLPYHKRIQVDLCCKFPFLVYPFDILFSFFHVSKKILRFLLSKMLYSKKKRGFRHLDKIYKSEKGNLNFYLIGTSDRSNIGDHIIAKSEMLNLSNWLPGINGFEITGDHYRSDKKRIASYITNKDLIFISGGGFLGDLWMDEENMVRDIIQRFPDNLIIILPQTIFFNDKYSLFNEYNRTAKIYNSHHNLYVFARDEDSYNLLKTFLPECRTGLFPDMALLFPEPIPKREINMKLVLTCFRTDKEQILDEETISLIEKGLEKEGYVIRKTSTLHSGKNNGDISLKQRDKIIQEKINEFSEASLIITDRLHGMIMSFLAGTPCIAFDNLSHKVSGVYNKWLSKCNYLFVVNDLEEYQHSLEKIKALNLEHYKHPSFEEEKKAIKGKILGLIAGENINE